MRFIDSARLALPDGWKEKAMAALARVAAMDESERARAINAEAQLWTQLKPALKALSGKKCWYCESKNLGSDNAVDHFRPKNSVRGTASFPLTAEHPGYWWLAFDPANYRFCCTFCNSIRKDAERISGGKQDYFPLFDEKRRARNPKHQTDLELPVLLDPTNAGDIGALWFDESGHALPRPKRPDEAEESYRRWKARAAESIALYHLDHPDIREARQSRAQEIKELLAEADKWLVRQDSGDPVAHVEAGARLKALWRALKPDAEYSKAVHCVLLGMRGSSAAARAVLELL